MLNKDHTLFQRAKGVPVHNALTHTMRNASLPIVTLAGIQLGYLLRGAVVIETLFAWPGVGQLAIQGINSRDYPVVQGVVVVNTFLFVVLLLLVDLSYGVARSPREEDAPWRSRCQLRRRSPSPATPRSPPPSTARPSPAPRRRRLPWFSGTILLVFVLTGLFAPLLAPYDPEALDLGASMQPPWFAGGIVRSHPRHRRPRPRRAQPAHLRRPGVAARVAIAVVVIAGIVGVTIAVVAGYKGGRLDAFLMRTTDASLAFPVHPARDRHRRRVRGRARST